MYYMRVRKNQKSMKRKLKKNSHEIRKGRQFKKRKKIRIQQNPYGLPRLPIADFPSLLGTSSIQYFRYLDTRIPVGAYKTHLISMSLVSLQSSLKIMKISLHPVHIEKLAKR